MKRILFVRHGSTDSNTTGVMRGWSNDPLSDVGRHQAELSAAYLATQPKIDSIYTSTLPRSIETGEILAKLLGVEPQARDDLRELNLGSLEGRSERELWGYFVQQSKAGDSQSGMRDIEFPGGESVSNFLTRTFTALKDISQRNDGSVLVVSHGVWTMVALGKWFESDLTQWPKFRVDNCSISEVMFEPAPRLIKVNETQHLLIGV
jgi:probable phosphoglycerate mutase